MQEAIDFFLTNNGLAFAVALIIFIITLWLVVKRLIGFVITLLLLVFALISGFFVANADLFREIVKGFAPASTPEERETILQLKAQFYKAFEEFKGELSDQKVEFEKILDRAKHREEPLREEIQVKPVVKSLPDKSFDKPVDKINEQPALELPSNPDAPLPKTPSPLLKNDPPIKDKL